MKTKLIIPAYSARMEEAALKAVKVLGDRCVVILNPNSGPRVDQTERKRYFKLAYNIEDHGASVLGYIDLHAGKGFTGNGPRRVRAIGEINAEIDIWNSMGVTEFFFDDATDYGGSKIKPLIAEIGEGIDLAPCILNPGGSSKLASFGSMLVNLEDSNPSTHAPANKNSAWIMLRRKTIPEFPSKLGAFFATDRSPSYAYQIPPTYWNKLLTKFK